MSARTPQTSYLVGKLLIAGPLIEDPRFERSVIYICKHDNEQAMGLMINCPMNGLKLNQVLDQIDIPGDLDQVAGLPVLDGGPVEREQGFVLHSSDVSYGATSFALTDEFTLTTSQEILKSIVLKQGPSQFVFVLGYSGWGAGQLEEEIGVGAWLVCEGQSELVFGLNFEDKWSKALESIGVNPYSLIAASGRA